MNTETPEFVLRADGTKSSILGRYGKENAGGYCEQQELMLQARLPIARDRVRRTLVTAFKSWRERQKEIDLRDLATLAADSRHIAQVAEANQTTLDMLEKVVNLNFTEASDQSNVLTMEHLRNEIEKGNYVLHCTKAKKPLSSLRKMK